MFDKNVYIARRRGLVERMAGTAAEGKRGIALFIGNVDAAAQYKDNPYKFRQNSSWLYYFGLDEPGMAAVIDLDNGKEVLFADDVQIGDIIWMGPQRSVAQKATDAGIGHSSSYGCLNIAVATAIAKGRPVHFLPAYRKYNSMKIAALVGISEEAVGKVAPMDEDNGRHASEELVKAVVSMRLVKEDIEIEQIDDACALGYEMHTTARKNMRVGVVEQELVGKMEGVALGKGWGVSFPTILTQHGETLHNHIHDKTIEPGKLLVIDAGAENNMHYASDFTRTLPTSGKFTRKQKDIYQIVCDCNELAFQMAGPGVSYRDVHLAVARLMLDDLRSLDIVRGNLDNMLYEGIAGLFMPHGLGHNMGLDVHDMEDLGENLVGYDPGQTRSKQLGLGSLRMARKLAPGNVITDEPGIYFIPALIALWKKEKRDKGFVNYHKLESFRHFGGIRLEDDLLITADGARRLGPWRLPIQPDDVEAAIAESDTQ